MRVLFLVGGFLLGAIREASPGGVVVGRCYFLAGRLLTVLRAADLAADFLAGGLGAGAGFFVLETAAVFAGGFAAVDLPRAARVLAASAALSSASKAAGVRGRADLRRRSMS